MGLTIEAIISGIDKIDVLYYKAPLDETTKRTHAENWKKVLPDSCSKDDFRQIIEYIITNTDRVNKFPKPYQIKQLYHDLHLEPVKEWQLIGCDKCYHGMRRYMAKVDIIDSETGGRIKKELPCAAACSSCKAGQYRNQEEGFLFYNDVMKRDDTRQLDWSDNPEEEIMETIKPSMSIEDYDDFEELPF